jgi:hypothetical protein
MFFCCETTIVFHPANINRGQNFCSFLSVPIREIRGSIPLVAAMCRDKLIRGSDFDP